MADDRYKWLDQDAAERLLRGEPADAAVGPHDAFSRAQAERLAEALADVLLEAGALGAPGAAHRTAVGEMPGEAAATAAFRKAVEARNGAAHSGSTRDKVGSLGTVRHSRRGAHAADTTQIIRLARPQWPARMGRSLRAGVAVAMAGCVLGGVAVAAGSGALPAPFGGGDGERLPAESVSAGATGEALSTPSGEQGSTQTPSDRPSGTSPSGDGTDSGDGRGDGRRDNSRPSTPGDGNGRSQDDAWLLPEGKGDLEGEKLKVALLLCRKHQAGTLDERTERRLEQAAGSAENLDRSCERLLNGDYRDASGGGDGNNGGGNDHGDGTDQGDEGKKTDGGDDGGGDIGVPENGDKQPSALGPATEPSSGASGGFAVAALSGPKPGSLHLSTGAYISV
ncbi:hypothetical protein [Streptomyces sp. NPDC051776]|uniref:hypothetical protein n=1 Tax=Streptomyces sp. NPDC051776 TaxID=3155414 RepID=UPI00342C9CC1